MSEPTETDDEHRWKKLATKEILGQGVRVRKTPRRSSGNDDEGPRDPETFAENLRGLARLAKMTPAEIAERCRISRRWYARLLTKGLARIDKRTRPGLERLAHHFGLGRVEDFWDPKPDRLRQRTVVEEQILTWSTKVNWPYAKKLLELLETGEYEHLKGLIDTLHALESLRMAHGAGAATGGGRPEDDGETGSIRQRLRRRKKKAGGAS